MDTRLMIVDDSEIIQESIAEMVGGLGIEVVGKASSGGDALVMLGEVKPDLVTMDITLPDTDGLTTMQTILERQPDVKVIVISAVAKKGIALDAMAKGAAAYLRKPILKEDLLAELNEIGIIKK